MSELCARCGSTDGMWCTCAERDEQEATRSPVGEVRDGARLASAIREFARESVRVAIEEHEGTVHARFDWWEAFDSNIEAELLGACLAVTTSGRAASGIQSSVPPSGEAMPAEKT